MKQKLLPTLIFSLLIFHSSLISVEIVVDKTIKKSTFKRDNAKEVVTNSATGLMWQDDSRAKNIKKDWEEAKNYCRNLTHAGYNDWYLPSIKELESIVDTTRYNPAIKEEFINTASSGYWSSSPSISMVNDDFWHVSFNYGLSYDRHDSDKFYVRCVRAGQ